MVDDACVVHKHTDRPRPHGPYIIMPPPRYCMYVGKSICESTYNSMVQLQREYII